MREKKLKIRSGSHVKGDPDVIAAELERIERKNGVLRSEQVRDEAKNPYNVLHSEFNWCDTSAANEHRLWQARQLIASVVYVWVDSPKMEPVRVYHHVDIGGDPQYARIDKVMVTPFLYDQVLEKAKKEALAWKDKWEHLTELKKIFQAMIEVFGNTN